MAEDLASMAAQVLDEIQRVFTSGDSGDGLKNPAHDLVEEIARVKKERQIVLHGVGREGLMMRAFTMRLYHLGLNAHCLGEMSCPPIGEGDLFIASAGPGSFSSVDALITTARDAGNKTLIHSNDASPLNSKWTSDLLLYEKLAFC
jgi:6-phospho-3-hexuloisomerase